MKKAEIVENKKMRFIYIGEKNNIGTPVTCVGYTIEGEKLKYSISYCSPEDRFSRKKAHFIIKGRYTKGKVAELPLDGHPKYEEVISIVRNDIKSKITKGEKVAGVSTPFWSSQRSDWV